MDSEIPFIKIEPELIIDDYDTDCLDSYLREDNAIPEPNNRKSEKIVPFKGENFDQYSDQKIATIATGNNCLFAHTNPFICDICNKSFDDKECLRNHIQCHFQLTCSMCDKRFRHAMNLQRHMLVHTGRRPFPCKICKRTYKHSSHLKRHLQNHTDGGRHKDIKPLKGNQDGSRRQKLVKLSKLSLFRKKMSRYILR